MSKDKEQTVEEIVKEIKDKAWELKHEYGDKKDWYNSVIAVMILSRFQEERSKREEVEAELREWVDDHKSIMDELCGDKTKRVFKQVHCTCVPTLKRVVKKLEKRLEKWESRYTCCERSPDCANNKTKKFVEELLGKGKWTKKKEYLYMVIESIETDRDFNKIKRGELKDKLHNVLKALEPFNIPVSSLKNIHGLKRGEAERIHKLVSDLKENKL